MDGTLSLIVRSLHIAAAALLVGGLGFAGLALTPALRDAAARAVVIGRWKRWMMISMTVLLATGFYNFFTVGLPKGDVDPGYHAVFGIKFLLALSVFFLASVLAGRAPAFESMREQPGRWYGIALLLGVAVIVISGVLAAS